MVKSTVALIVFIILAGSIMAGFATAERLSYKLAERTVRIAQDR